MILSSFKTYVKRDLKRTDKDTEIVRAYNDMITWVAQVIPHGGYKYQSYISTVVRQEDYPLPTNLIHLIHPVKLLEGSGTNDYGYPLERITKEEYDIQYPNPNRTTPTDIGKPSVYTIFSRSILVGPLPDSASYLLEINWAKRATELSGDSDTPNLGSEWDEVLKQGTLERVYAGMGMFEEANYWASLYRDKFGNPVGLCRRLIDSEKDIEMKTIGQVKFNEF